ncbi:MAG TPA: DUF2269 family protein [Gaiellaceae bacterium]|nr:DUF2269 family protein [Gaiellaceae bacterium]
MSYYEVLLFLHLAAVAVWLGSGFFLQMLVFRAGKTGNEPLLQGVASNSGWMAQRIFIPASLVVLMVGILLTIEGPWSFGDLWIVLGLAGYAFSFLVGILFIEPEGKRIAAAMAVGDQGRAAFHVSQINTVSRIELVVLYLVVAVMALKPTGDDTGTLVVAAALLLAAVAYWAPKLRPAAA